jgi:hypothetical protein
MIKQHEMNSGDHYKYAGKCRNCGFHCSWVSLKKSETTYRRFFELTWANFYPQFIAFCENCDNEAVFDLTAISKQSENTTKSGE